MKRKKNRDKNEEVINFKNIKNINENNILLEQEQVNGKALDQGFICHLKKDNAYKNIFIGLQMKCLSDKANHSTMLKNITKSNIKENIKNILLRSKLDYNIKYDEWHYFIIAYYNTLDKDNNFCRELNNHCKKENIAIIYYHPVEQALYLIKNNKFEKTREISLSELSNLDCDFLESNPYHIIYDKYKEELIDSYYEQRFDKIIYGNTLKDKYLSLIQKYNMNKDEVNKKIEEFCGKKNIKLIECLSLNDEMPIPYPNENYLFLFVNNEKNNCIGVLRKNKFEAKNFGNDNTIKIIDISKFIDSEEKEFFVFYFNK